MPIIDGYWLKPSMTASAAARRMSSGPGSSGKPWPRLMALLSRASCDMASKIVTGRSANTLFMEVMDGLAAGLRRQSRCLPGQHAARKMLVVGQACGLRRERGRYRSLPGTARKNHLLAVGIGNAVRVETRQRSDDRAWISFHGNFVRLSDVDQNVASLGYALRYIFRRQIVNLLRRVRHSNSSNICHRRIRQNGTHRSRPTWPTSPLAA